MESLDKLQKALEDAREKLRKDNDNWIARVKGHEGEHEVLDINDNGKPMSEKDWGNMYTLKHGKTGETFTVHQSQVHGLRFPGMKEPSIKKDDLDDKIHAKMQAEMERRGTTGRDIADHYRDIDESIPAKQRTNIKEAFKQQTAPKPKLEVVKIDDKGQWSIEKDDSVKPFGTSVYNQTANLNRKMTRTGEVRDTAGKNQAVRSYTTSGSSMQQAHEKAQDKAQQAKAKDSVRTFKDMSEEEKAALKAKYETPKT